MNYNEYDGNGNKKKFDILEIINDRQKRSRFLLVLYLIIFIFFIIFIRLNINSSDIDKDITKNTNKEIIKEETKIKELEDSNNTFLFLDMNNYDFIFNINVKDSVSVIEGKRYNDKFSFTLNNNGNILYFNGVSNYIKAKETIDGEYKLTGFPYVLVNIFDTNVIKELINNATLNNDIYEIKTEEIGRIINYGTLNNGEAVNTIELIKKNNKVTEINLDLSNAISSYMNDSVTAKISLKYSNFGLIDDFKIE